MSYLTDLATVDVVRATGRTYGAEHDRATTARIAWLVFRAFGDRTIRVPMLFGIRWTVRLRDLRPLWAQVFGDEPAPDTEPPVWPRLDPAA